VFRELDVVRLKSNDDAHGVKTSYLGTIVDVPAPGVYTVEFMDEDNETIMSALFKVYHEDELQKA